MAVLIDNEKDLYMLLISELRYSIQRDNHLAPSTCCDLIKTYLPQMSEPWRSHTARQLIDESIHERIWRLPISEPDYKIYSYGTDNKNQLENDCIWEELTWFLLDYIIDMPYEAERYMQYIYGHMDYFAKGKRGIVWRSEEILQKISYNKEKSFLEKEKKQ
jgi:hypothetical protein